MITRSILKEGRDASTIHIINNLVRGLTNKKAVKNVETDYFVFVDNTIDTIIDMIQNKAVKTAIVVDDLGLQVINRLGQEGIRDITLVIARLPESCMPTIKYIITNTFPDVKVTIKHINEIGEHMKTDLLISNPAYGSIGANITDMIRQKIDFEEFINLLPANDYKRNDDKNLYNYQSDMVSIKDGFADAAVTTHVARIHKTKVNNMTLDEFEVSNYTDKILFKYFTENRLRKHYAIDAANLSGATDKQFKQFDLDTTVTVSSRDVNHKHLPYSKTCETYRYNVSKDITNEEIFESRKATRNGVYDGWLSITGILNNTKKEKDNQVAFMYSKNGFRFLAKVFAAVNADSTLNFGKVFPKVDWTHSWTVEEILANYGYTPNEIKEVMADLENFKGMDD